MTTHRPRIVFLDGQTINTGDLSWEIFEQMGDFTVYDRTESAHVVERAASADIILLNKTPLQREHFAKLPGLRMVCVAATGYDVVDIAAARAHGIPVCNCAGYGTRAVAQMVVAHLLEVTNRVGHYAEANRRGFWCKSRDFCCWDEPLMELENRRAAIVGFGNIGQAVAGMLRPFGVKLCAVTSKRPADLPVDVQKITLEEAFSACDIVSLNCPLTPDNTAFVNDGLLKNANPRLILINTARGKLVDEEAIACALRENRLGAYCADVLSQEPPSTDNPLLTAPRCYITPHIAWATADARQRILDIIAGNIRAFMAGKPVNVVNP